MIVADILTKAKKLNNYDLDATAGGLWTSTTTYRATVPAGKRWFVIGGVVNRDVSATVVVYLHDVSGNVLMQLAYWAAATGHAAYPISTYSGAQVFPFALDAGEYVEITLGAAQSTAAYATAVVLEVGI